MSVVHNVQYFYWFEQGRLQIMEELLSLEASLKLGVAMPVVENQCSYQRPVRYGDPLVLLTEHQRPSAWEGRRSSPTRWFIASSRRRWRTAGRRPP